MKKQDFRKIWNQKMNSFIEIQQLIFDYDNQASDESFISIFPEEIFFCRTSLLNILQMIIANASIDNFPSICSFFESASTKIKEFFTSDDLFSIAEHNFIRLWLYENGFIQFDTILTFAESSPSVFCYFSIEIKEKKFSEFLRIQKYSPIVEFRNIIKGIDFSTFREQRSRLMNDSTIAKIIREDDVEKLQKFLSQTNISINSTIPYSIFEICQYINRNETDMPTLIEFASFCGSINTFKFLFMNDAKLKESTIDYAINGGNIEIIHILENSNCSFNTALDAAIHDQKDDIVDYILDNKGMQFNIDSVCTSIVNLNYKILNRTLDIIYDNPNDFDSDGITPLIYAAENNCIEIVNLLLSIKVIDINKSDLNNLKFPLFVAAKNNSVDVLNILLKKTPEIDINKVNNDDLSSLMIAIVRGYLNVVQILCDQPNIFFKTNFNLQTNHLIDLAILYGHLKIIKFLLSIYIIEKNFRENIDEFIVKTFSLMNWEIIKYFLSIHHDLWKINVIDRASNIPHVNKKDIQKLVLLIDKFRKEKLCE